MRYLLQRLVSQSRQYFYYGLIVYLNSTQEKRLQWWCSLLATRPDFQGNGFATALMNIGYQKASYVDYLKREMERCLFCIS